MASIVKQNLEIIPNDEKRIAQVNVKCEVHFTDQEMETMLQNPARTYFTLFCWLMGKDFGKVGPIDTDDWIFSFEAKTFSDDDPTQVEEVLFSADLSYSLLNEDVLGTDEIFAELMLTGWRPFNSKERATTGIVEYEFG